MMVFEMLQRFHPTLFNLSPTKQNVIKVQTQVITMAGEIIHKLESCFDTSNLYYDDELCNNSPNAINLRFHLYISEVVVMLYASQCEVTLKRFVLSAISHSLRECARQLLSDTFRNVLLTTSIFFLVCANKTSYFCVLYTFIVFICKYCLHSIQESSCQNRDKTVNSSRRRDITSFIICIHDFRKESTVCQRFSKPNKYLVYLGRLSL